MAAEPEEILDEDHEQVLERVAAVDVAKASGKVCLRVPSGDRVGAPRQPGVGLPGDHRRRCASWASSCSRRVW